jgi:transglutaminase-like putative cysteine protease
LPRSSYHDKIIQLPYRGAPTTVAAIRQAALSAQNSYVVRELAEEICEKVKARDYVSEPLAIFYFVCAKTRYTRDPRTTELVRTPELIASQLRDGARPMLDCDDMAALICALCLAVGCPARVVTVAFRDMFYAGQRQYEHVFAQALDPKTQTWIVLDPVAGKRAKEMLRNTKAAKIWNVA